jgi:RNA polymerase sigma-70 factor (ECF subfamily)
MSINTKTENICHFPSGNPRLYERMKTSATSGLIALSMENPALEFENFDQVVTQYRTRVFRFVLASLGDMDVAESLTQDCFWNAYKSRKSFRGECSMNTWLMRIAVNLVRSHVRSRRLQFWKKAERINTDQIHHWADRSISPEERASVNEQVLAIWEAARTLSEKQRTVFVLRFVEDLNNTEIAQSTGMTVSTVNVHLSRALRRIRKSLGTGNEPSLV